MPYISILKRKNIYQPYAVSIIINSKRNERQKTKTTAVTAQSIHMQAEVADSGSTKRTYTTIMACRPNDDNSKNKKMEIKAKEISYLFVAVVIIIYLYSSVKFPVTEPFECRFAAGRCPQRNKIRTEWMILSISYVYFWSKRALSIKHSKSELAFYVIIIHPINMCGYARAVIRILNCFITSVTRSTLFKW